MAKSSAVNAGDVLISLGPSMKRDKVRRMLCKSLESDAAYIQQNNDDDIPDASKAYVLQSKAHDILECSVDEIDTPFILISVIGDSSDFQPKKWSKLSFQKAIIQLVKRAEECLVMYNKPEPGSIIGTLVENAFKNHSIKKGRLLRYRYVRSEDDKELDPRDTGICLYSHKLTTVCNLRKKTIMKKTKEYSTTMYKLEHYIHEVGKIKIEFINKVNKIPVVLILAEGDIHSIRHVAEAITMETIVYIIKGSGKAADLIAECLEQGDYNSNCFERKVAQYFGLGFYLKDQLKEYLKTINENSWRITVFDIDREEPTVLADKISESVSSLLTLGDTDFKDDYCWIPNIYIPLAYSYIQKHKKYDSFKASSLLRKAVDVSPDVVNLLLDNGASLKKIYDHAKDSCKFIVPKVRDTMRHPEEVLVNRPVIDILHSDFESEPWNKANYYRERLQSLRKECQTLVGYQTKDIEMEGSTVTTAYLEI